jgi:cytochrome c-type biogenesis protein CcmE
MTDGDVDLDLTPRPARPARGRRVVPVLLIVLVVAAIGALLFKTLGDASLFFKNTDEAVSQRSTLGDKRFKMQGTVVDGTVTRADLDGKSVVTFSVKFNGVEADVVHVGNPPELFKPDVPVVLEGRWTEGAPSAGTFTSGANDGWYFASDRMLVKHDNQYDEANNDRIKQAVEGGQAPVKP